MRMLRHDTFKLDKLQVLDNGFLKLPITATRTGIFVYRLPDGSEFRELRPAEEVFDTESLESMRGLPMTKRHPTTMVDSKNAKELSIGFTSDTVSRDGDFVRTTGTITDQEAIDSIAKEDLKEVSCGYVCDVEETPGVINGEKFDAIQRNIRYNHLAIVEKGRAGPKARLHLDGQDKESSIVKFINLDRGENSMKMVKIKIDGMEFEVSEAVGVAFNALTKDQKSKLDAAIDELKTAKESAEKLQAKLDAFSEELEKAKKEKLDSDQVSALVKKRVALEGLAARCLKEDEKAPFSEMSDKDLKVAIVKSDSKDIDLSEKSDAYIDARVDILKEKLDSAPSESKKKLDSAMTPKSRTSTNKEDNGDEPTYEERRQQYINDSRDEHLKPLAVSKS